jgi:phosphatidylserine/phosphatidylglycerophosphate/cardiolipin synthase-like enzyme
MPSKFRGLVVVLSALALTSTVLVETIPSAAQAKPLASGPIAIAGSVRAASAIVNSSYGPTGCVDGAEIKMLDATTVVKSLAELGNLCTKFNATGDNVALDAIKAGLKDTSAPPASPTTPFDLTSNSPDIAYSIDPTATTALLNPTLSAGVLTISPTAGTVDGNIAISASQTYEYVKPETTDGATPPVVTAPAITYTYIGKVTFLIPIKVRPVARPTCQIFTTSTLRDTPVDIALAYDALNAGGCRGGYGTLTYAITGNNSGAATVTGATANFVPNPGFITASDNTVKAFFYVSATDEYGQTSVALDQYGGAITNATITVNVSEPRACTGATAKTETVFNNPIAGSSRDNKLSNSRFAITNRIIDMIDCTSAGQTIAMSWFSFTDDNMVNHLIQAHRAGVNVRILLNSHATKSSSSSFTAVNTLRAALGSNITDANANASANPGSWITWCESGCLTPPAKPGVVFPDESEGEYPAMHAKFFLISQAGSAKRIVGISSVNPTYEQARVGFNNASVVVNDKTLYDSMNGYYADLITAARGLGKATAYRQLKTDSKTTAYYIYPKTGADDVLKMLRDVKCIYKVGKKTMRTQIYVNMFVFTRNAPAMELWRKAFNSTGANGGCNVQIIYTDMDQRIKALNTSTNKTDFIPNGDRPSSWGAADCLSTLPKPQKGKPYKLTGPGLVFDTDTGRMTAASVCKFGSLQGAMPTINKSGGYCWFKAKAKGSGGTLEMCVSTPLKITAFDKADNRAKLEPVADASGARWYSHQKYIAIDGMYGPKGAQKRQQIVISGTPNITSPGQRWNDEILTFTTSAEIYAQHAADFNALKTAILRRPGPSSIYNPNGATARW